MDASLGKKLDYIIIGAGSAGCVVAARLSENPDVEVLLLEAGGSDAHSDVEDPVKWPRLLRSERAWQYETAPLRHCNNRVDRVPRGKMLGGCHSLNANIWARGHRSDFDGWEEQGCRGWGWSDVLRLYRKSEDWNGVASELRGVGGPLYVAPPTDPHPLATAFVESSDVVGVPRLEDHNGPEMEGAGFANLTIKNGQRHSVVNAYLRSAMNRPNLTVITHAETSRLLIEGTRCVGVEYEHEGTLKSVRAECEIILATGVIGSPCILMRSGIGPEDQLKRLGIDVVFDSPGVGQNLHDHPMIGGINYECKVPMGAPHHNGVEASMWWRSKAGLIGPDIQALLLEFPYATPALADRLPSSNCYTIAPLVARPASRGSMTLSSANFKDSPIIDVNFMASDSDVEVMLAAIEMCRNMGASDAFAPFRKREVMPGKLNRREMIEFIRMSTTTCFHPVGTCKMGVDRDAVVDPELRVRGIKGLRVADASIMPTITCGNTNAPAVMIGEKAAEMIVGN
ncbi:MAG: GMC family oxidoreductase N-terminal domain-containing protein [Planctomycetes bacterium]|nr:GMC family oxidoreductase N-terminal domain-containing protein [Planctomycetota bacterium]